MEKRNFTPANIFLSDVADVPPHTHESHEMLFMLSGQCNVFVGEEHFLMSEGDILLINSQLIHSYRTEGTCMHIVFQFELDKFPLLAENQPLTFTVNSVKYPDESRYNYLRHLLARLVLVQTQEDYNTGSISVLYEIISELNRSFTSDRKSAAFQTTSKYMERLSAILAYITEHYAEGLSLTSVASAFHLSVPYLSSFFKKYMHLTFMEYYNNIRLTKTTTAMLESDESIDVIAHQNGFTDTRTYVKLFRQKYGVLPSQYRKSIRENPFPAAHSRGGNIFHPSLGKSVYESKLLEFIQQKDASYDILPAMQSPSAALSCGTLVASLHGRYLFDDFHFQKICYLNDITDLMLQNVQEMLLSAHQELSFEGCWFPLLEQNIFFLGEGVRFLNSIHLMPFFVIDCTQNAVTDETLEHLQASIQFLTHTFGTNYLKNCCFFLTCTRSGDCFPQYRQLATLLKTLYADISIACPPLPLLTSEDYDFSRRFLSDCQACGCLPDRITFPYCERDLRKQYSPAEDYNQTFHDSIRRFLSGLHLSDIPYQLFDTGTLQASQNPINDSCFRSCYVIHDLLVNLGRGNYISLWKLSDFQTTAQAPLPLFHGGLGLLTYNGIPKPSYYVLSFFHQLGNEVLKIEDGWIVTRRDNLLIILFYNFQFYRNLLQHPENLPSKGTFDNMEKTYYSLKLDKVDGDYFRIMQYCINQNHGSTFDFWNRIGSPPFPEEPCMNFLRDIRTNDVAVSGRINNEIINLEVDLEPLEVRLVVIDVIKTK